MFDLEKIRVIIRRRKKIDNSAMNNIILRYFDCAKLFSNSSYNWDTAITNFIFVVTLECKNLFARFLYFVRYTSLESRLRHVWTRVPFSSTTA